MPVIFLLSGCVQHDDFPPDFEGCSGPMVLSDVVVAPDDPELVEAEVEALGGESVAEWGQSPDEGFDKLVFRFSREFRLHRTAVTYPFTSDQAVGASAFPWGVTSVGPGTVMTDSGSVPWAGVTATFGSAEEATLMLEYATDGAAVLALFDVRDCSPL